MPAFVRQVTAAALTIAVIVAIMFAQPIRDLWQPDGQRGIGSPTEESASVFPPNTGRGLFSIVVRPVDAGSGTITVGFWDVTLAPGSVLHVPGAIRDLGNQAIAAWVDSGTVMVGASGFEHEVRAGSTTAMEPAPEYIRNEGPSEARLLLLVPMNDSGTFPLQFTGRQDGNGLATPAPDTFAHLIDVVPLDARDAAQYLVTVNADTYLPGDVIEPWAGPPDRSATMRSVTVWQGEATLELPSYAATPGVRQLISSGDTVTRSPSLPDGTLLVATGPENLTLLTLESTPWSENPTLDQTVDAFAPYWGEWVVPISGEVNLAVRAMTLPPGAVYELPTLAGVMYYLADGNLAATDSAAGTSGALGPGGVVAQIPGSVITFTNDTTAPARLIQSLVYDGSLEDEIRGEQLTGVEAELLVQASGSLPAGAAIVMLDAHEYNGVNDGGSSGSGGTSLTLLTAADGSVQVRRDGGEAKVTPGNGENPNQPPLGDGIVIVPGDSMLVQPGGGWAITGAPGETGTGLVLTVSPKVDGTAFPQASPVATPSTTITLQGDPDSCDVVPLTTADVDTLMATPAASDDPLARSARDLVGEPADAATAAAIVATMQGYADCTATGIYAMSTTYMSDRALRESETYRDLIVENFQVGETRGQITSIEDIVTFEDGRAGARVVMNGEAAYITFVLDDGQWKIDVWDDSEGGPSTTNPHD